MRAVTYDAYSKDNSRLRVGEVPEPRLGPGQVLVKVRAAGVNPVDWKVMAGGLDPMMAAVFPVIPGWDVAGEVTAVGPDTREFAVGHEVIAYARKDVVNAGTFAEYVAVSADAVARKPASLGWEQAGGLPLAGLTALRSLDRLQVGAGDTVVVYAASGGVGGVAVQIARYRGARVIGTASERNHDYVRSLGGEPVAYGDGLAERILALAPDGVHAVADFVGGQLDTTLAVLGKGGRHVSVADPSVREHGGQWIWVRPDGAALAEVAGLVESGAVGVEIAGTYSLDEVGAAFDASRSGRTRGKLIIVP
ncbi:NADP-dependent oxidoreductase [Nocardia aurantia]|uniref:Narbonolide/10-deoxymethynolide synthase PikA2, modules 3 and 4 n=1 Tax=Nocardia aurantia TaxID=2585199 RepID=A0A7K0DLP7_9NOCA|nr:NADP-dependent oxidoreductase [Nocardia aurantia]MQY26676.1 Narbonolide/10-deoxymethynolide synthase PikA2, modules 3 and 4 [Nocardia aurantia]